MKDRHQTKAPTAVLETDRLVLRHLTENDAAFILKLLNEPSFLRFIGDKGARTLADARAYLLGGPIDSYARHGFGLYLVALKESGVPIGICGLLQRASLPDVDLGFAFLPAYWRQGYAFESASSVMAHERKTQGLRRIVAVTQPDNVASVKTLEKLGMTFERMVRLTKGAPEIRLFASDG